MITSAPTTGIPVLHRAEAEQYIIEAMQVLERQAMYVSRIQLTKPYYDLLGQPQVFEQARVNVGEHNIAMSDPEFFGFSKILFDGSRRKTWEELAMRKFWQDIRWISFIILLIIGFFMGFLYVMS